MSKLLIAPLIAGGAVALTIAGALRPSLASDSESVPRREQTKSSVLTPANPPRMRRDRPQQRCTDAQERRLRLLDSMIVLRSVAMYEEASLQLTLQAPADLCLRLRVIQMISAVVTPPSSQVLIDAARGDPHGSVRRAAARALALWPSPNDSISAFVASLGSNAETAGSSATKKFGEGDIIVYGVARTQASDPAAMEELEIVALANTCEGVRVGHARALTGSDGAFRTLLKGVAARRPKLCVRVASSLFHSQELWERGGSAGEITARLRADSVRLDLRARR
jgi:hypothetical protein